jgi:type II secretory pathway pseudopilin PulG
MLRETTRVQGGFNIIEIMIAVGIMAIIGAGVAAMMTNMNRSVMSTAATSDFNTLVNTIQGVLNNNQNCITAFGGPGATQITGAFPQNIALNIGGSAVAPGPYGSNLKITTLALTSRSAAGSANQWVVPMSLVASRVVGGGAMGGQTISHTYNLVVTTDAANKIQDCSGQNTDYWVAATNSPANIEYSGGNVGIGTTAPTSPLSISANLNTAGNNILENLVNAGAPNSVIRIQGTAGSALFGTDGAGNAAMGSSTANNAVIVTSAVERMRVTSTGNVGIGTTNPSTTLHVAGNIYAPGVIGLGRGMLNYNTYGYEVAITPAPGVAPFVVQTGAGASALTVMSSGNVGVSTNTPTASLDVHGSLFITDSTSPNVIRMYNHAFGASDSLVQSTGPRLILAGGPGYCAVESSSIFCTSDSRLKTKVSELQGATHKIEKLKGLIYSWKSDKNSRRNMGLFAQEVACEDGLMLTDKNGKYVVGEDGLLECVSKRIFPEAVSVVEAKDSDRLSQTLTLNYAILVAPLIESVKELHSENAVMKAYLCKKDPSAAFCVASSR